MQTNSSLLRAWIILLAIVGMHTAMAQEPPLDSLGGKIVHVYLPSDDIDTLIVRNWGFQMVKNEKYWFTATLRGDRYNSNQGFFFANPRSDQFITKAGLANQEVQTARFMLEDFQGKNEMWIVIDPSGPINATPTILLEPPKIVHILNPWLTTGPRLAFAGGGKGMVALSDKCGWFMAFLLKPAELSMHFQEINGTETYGAGGFGSSVNYDMAALFAANGVPDTLGTRLWLDTDINTWLPAYPNKDGECQYMMAATVRDFSLQHPDFDFGNLQGDHLVTGMVQETLGPNRKPVRTTKQYTSPAIFNDFESWWRTDTAASTPQARRAYETCVDIPMSKSSDGLWEYDTYKTENRGFFPIDDFDRHQDPRVPSCYNLPNSPTQWVTGQKPHNLNFCMESHAKFIYQPGQKFEFRGDDDVWVFIDNKLAIDLGGIHTPKADTINLDDLGLSPGKEYTWDFFYCERQPCGSSLKIKTSIFFRQQRALDTVIVSSSGVVQARIIKREGGTGSCAGLVDTVRVVDASNLVYRLWDANGNVVDTLKNGDVNKFGGITIATPNVSVDTSKVTGLAPGNYRIIAFEPANERLRVEIPFKVNARNFVEFDPPYVRQVALGVLVPVVAVNREAPKTDTVRQADPYTVIVPAGLLVYQDAARTQVVPAGQETRLTVEANGLDTLWVAAPVSTEDQSFVLGIKGSQKSVTLTFIAPKNRVELEPPATIDTMMNSVVRILAANREPGQTEPKAEAKVYNIVFPPGLQVFADEARTIPVANLGQLTTAADGWDTLWVTADSVANGLMEKTFLVKIDKSVNEVSIRFRMPPVVLPDLVAASIHDDDGDGIGDRIVAAFDRDISAWLPLRAEFAWPPGGAVVPIPTADLPSKVTGADLVHRGAFSASPLTAGQGTFSAAYLSRGKDSVQTVTLADRIGPILLKAEAILGITEDTLRLTFSEPVPGIAAPPVSLFGYRLQPDAPPVEIAPLSIAWNADHTVASLVFPRDGATVPRSGDLVRITDGPGLIADVHGNPAGPASRFRLITGLKRSEIRTVTYKEITPGPVLIREPAVLPSLQGTQSPVEEVVERTGRMGHLIKTDLGDYAVTDDFTTVSPSQVVLEYTASYFTNHGVPVASDRRTLACTDPIFQGNCITNRGFLFVGWNYTAKDGARVGTGAYIARLRYQVKVAGAVKESGGLDQTWGVVRRE